jgi:sarcosine oxidase subunit gamma
VAETLIARSPLDGFAPPGRHGKTEGEPGVRLADRTGIAIASVIARRGKAAALGAAARTAFGIELPATPRRVAAKGIAFIWTGPGQWIAIREAPAAESLEAALSRALAGLAAVAEQGDGRAVVRIAGPRARDTLAKGVPIDLHARAFRPGDTALTLAGHIGIQIWQIDDAPTFEIAVARGYARSFWEWLTASAAEYGYDVAVRA